MTWTKYALLVFAGIILQTQFRLLSADLMAVAVFYLALRFHWAHGAFFAFWGGLIWDALSGTPLGMRSFALMTACGLLGFFQSLIFQEHLITRFAMVFLGTAICFVVERFVASAAGLNGIWVVERCARLGLYTAAVALVVYPFLDAVFFRRRHFYAK